MLIDSQEISIPAGATVNVFAGRPVEFWGGGQPGVMRLLLCSDPLIAPGGIAPLTVSMTQNLGGNQTAPITPGTTINAANATAAGLGLGVGPKDDEDTILPALPMPVGIRTSLNITNPGAAATIVRYRAIVA